MKSTMLVCLTMASVLVTSSAARAGIIEDLANATIVEEFLFDDVEGTGYAAAANNAGTGHLLTPVGSDFLNGVATNGAGALDGSLKSNVSFGTATVDNADILSGRVLGVMELTWNFTSALDTAENEEIRLSILNAGTSTVTAEFEIERNDFDQLEIFGTAVNGSSIPAVILNGGSLLQSQKFIAVVDVNLDTDRYFVHFSSDGGGSFTTIGPGNIDPVRIGEKLRFGLNNDLSDDNVLIDRIYLATIPEPSSLGLGILGMISLLAIGQRRTQ